MSDALVIYAAVAATVAVAMQIRATVSWIRDRRAMRRLRKLLDEAIIDGRPGPILPDDPVWKVNLK